jgi:serine protease Do
MMRLSAARWVARGILLGGVCAGIVGIGDRGVTWAEEPGNAAPQAAMSHARGLSQAFHHAAEVVLPTVVKVESKTKPKSNVMHKGRAASPEENPFKGTPFEHFFGEDNLEDFGDMSPMPHGRQEGMGSGVIIDSAGIIVTNNHVVDGADEVTVVLADGRDFKAESIVTDKDADLAVIRIKGAGTLPAAKFGNSDVLDIGDWVLAIGYPFGLEQTVSAGIVSAKGRQIEKARAKIIQTDAAINPGNSGGPLINLDGEIVGINTAIATNTGSFSGIGFAVPSNTVKWVADQLIDKGSVQRAYLGISIQENDPDLSRRLHATPGQGIIVGEVMPDTPAAEAGMQVYDVLLQFDNTKVSSRPQLQELVERVPIGSKHKLLILRDEKQITLEVATKALPKNPILSKLDNGGRGNGRQRSEGYYDEALGIEVDNVSADQLAQLRISGGGGVLVIKVNPDSPAAEHGVTRGVVIQRVGKTQIKSLDDFKAALAKEKLADGILMQIRGPQGSQLIVVSP